ncbi:NAD-dependent epimerase/dehydratase family protein [Microbacterium rhizophilus]|uniref:NAD-dependent epimerase/dehydratase family protein n=1 Tax=Microbacterium rhizophilus TaxID=3138934 RepID=UPI0031EBDFA6
MSRIAVTGGAGRLGRSVVRALAEAGHEVVSIDRTSAEGLPARQLDLDLLDAAATRQAFARIAPDAVVHLAAIAVPGSRPDFEIFDINTRLLWSVLEGALAAGAGALLVASSPTVIGYGAPSGWEPAYLPLDEAHPVAPWNGYATSKAAIEEIVRMAVRRDGHRARFGVFRPCYVIAPEEWAGAPTQQGHTVAERLADPALSAVALFNYLDARDAGDFVTAWLDHAEDVPNGAVFFVGAPDALVAAPTAEALATHVPETAGAAAALPGTAAVFSSARAERLLGWRARRTWRTELDAPPSRPDPLRSAEAPHA